MKRRLILIANTGTPSNPALGADKDIKDYKDFFISDCGGAWDDNEEIIVFHSDDPEPLSKDKLCQSILSDKKNGCEYFLIVFCGHGGTDIDGDTFFELSENNICKLSELKSLLHDKKFMLIADSCRSVVRLHEGGRISKRKTFTKVDRSYRELCREYYNHVITKASAGAYTIGYSAAWDETAQDLGRNQGGLFSQTLLDEIHKRIPMLNKKVTDAGSEYKCMSLSACIKSMKPTVAVQSGNRQNPECASKDGKDELPFIICPIWQLQLDD